MKISQILEVGTVVVVGVAGYLVVKKIAKTGASFLKSLEDVLKYDLNPASPDNVVYKSLSDSVQEKIGNAISYFFTPEDYDNYMRNLSSLDKQAQTMNAHKKYVIPADMGMKPGSTDDWETDNSPRASALGNITGTHQLVYDQLGNVLP